MTKNKINEISEPQISVTITLSRQVVEKLNKLSFNTGNHRTDIIRVAISNFLERECTQED